VREAGRTQTLLELKPPVCFQLFYLFIYLFSLFVLKEKNVSANIPVKVTERKPGRQSESQSQKSLCRERNREKDGGVEGGGKEERKRGEKEEEVKRGRKKIRCRKKKS